MRNVCGNGAEELKRHILFSATRAIYEIMWKNMEEPNRPLMKM